VDALEKVKREGGHYAKVWARDALEQVKVVKAVVVKASKPAAMQKSTGPQPPSGPPAGMQPVGAAMQKTGSKPPSSGAAHGKSSGKSVN
jgi:hypothetical protein